MKKSDRRAGSADRIDRLTKIVLRGFKLVEQRMERGFAAAAEDIDEIKLSMTTKEDLAATEKRLHEEIVLKTGNIEPRLDQELFDKRKQVEVRVDRIETHFGIKPPAGTTSR